MLFDRGEFLIGLMIAILSAKYVWMFYHVAKELHTYADLEEEKRKAEERQREEQRAYAHAQKKQRYQEQPRTNTSFIQISSSGSRYAKELEFYKACKDPFRIIGCTMNASADQMKRSYRALVKKWHPDRIEAMGVSKQELADATLIIQIINIAYEEAVRRRKAYAYSA